MRTALIECTNPKTPLIRKISKKGRENLLSLIFTLGISSSVVGVGGQIYDNGLSKTVDTYRTNPQRILDDTLKGAEHLYSWTYEGYELALPYLEESQKNLVAYLEER